MPDAQYGQLPDTTAGVSHRYGPRVHILSHPWPMSLLARLGEAETRQPQVDDLTQALYDWLLGAVLDRELRRATVSVPTRMHPAHAEGVYQGQVLDPTQRVVVVDIARAGMLPAHRCYHQLNQVLNPDNIRQDHIIASRATNEQGQVVGLRMDTTKLGGPIDDATVLIPDPMAATGTSTSGVIQHYLDHAGGTPRKLVVMHLIITPEYLRRMTSSFPELEIYAIRLDRGLSSPEILGTTPGERWDEERGLNPTQYIVPGAGGLGEVLNNSWV